MTNSLANRSASHLDFGAGVTNWAPHALSVLRIVVGLLYIEHGTQKLFNTNSG